MPRTYTWYSFDEMEPDDKEWVLVADDRFETPKKALFKRDCVDRLSYDDGKMGDADYPWEHVYAWMPMPLMPTRPMVEGNVVVQMPDDGRPSSREEAYGNLLSEYEDLARKFSQACHERNKAVRENLRFIESGYGTRGEMVAAVEKALKGIEHAVDAMRKIANG